MLFSTRGHISRGIRLPRVIRVVPPIGIICIAIWGIGWRFALTNKIGLVKEHLSYCWNGRTTRLHAQLTDKSSIACPVEGLQSLPGPHVVFFLLVLPPS